MSSECFIVIRESVIVSEHIIVNTPVFISTNTHFHQHMDRRYRHCHQNTHYQHLHIECPWQLILDNQSIQVSTLFYLARTTFLQTHRPVLPARMYYCFQYEYIVSLIKAHNQQHKYYCHQYTYHCLHLCIIISIRIQCSTSICNTFK